MATDRIPGANGKDKSSFATKFSSMLEYALYYAENFGWPVFPVNPLNKVPYPGSHGFYDATFDKDQIRRSWRQHPDAMIATATGLHSGTLVVDLDRKEGGADGVATWAKLTAEHGGMPVTLLSETPSTGQHHIFRHRYGLRCVALDKIAPGVEVKADGGFIVLPPSLYTGPNRRRYVWQNNIALAEPPDWLVALIREHNDHALPGDPAPSDSSVPYERIVAALGVIDPDINRDPWIHIGCALLTQLGDEAGFKLWNEWSSKGKKYVEREMDGQWKSLVKKRYPYAIGTVFYHANQAQPSWNRSEEPNQPGHVDDGGHHARQEEWPEMDGAAYHGIAGKLVETISPHSESDPVALLLQTLTCFGNIIGRARYYQVESTRHQSNLFVTLVGASSKTRKGTSLDRVKAVVGGIDPGWSEERIQSGLSSGEGLINVVRDPIMKRDKDGDMVEVDAGVADKRLLLVEPEFASVLAVMERKGGNTVSALIRKAWDGLRLQTLTRQSPLTATGAHISIIGHITEDELRTCLTRTDMANGFANRFLFVLVKRSKELPFGGALAHQDIQRLAEALSPIIDYAKGDQWEVAPTLITMTEAARAEWARIYSDLSAAHSGLFGAVTARAEAQTIRLALIYALLDKTNQVDLDHLKAALAVWRYCEASAAHIFGTALGDETADTILRGLINAGKDGMTRLMINDLFGGKRKSSELGTALGLLLQEKRARFETRSTGGRPVETWFAK